MNQNPAAIVDTPENINEFESFDLSVHLGPDAIPWISATSRAGAVHSIPRNTTSSSLPNLLDLVYDYTDDIQFAEPQPDPALSKILGKLVFGDSVVTQLFQATRGVAAEKGRQLLVRLLASPHLAVLPWELLPDPSATQGGHKYLALAPDTHLIRQARGRTYPPRTKMLDAPLNLLLVLSSPRPKDNSEEWLSFDIFEIKRNLLAELEPLVKDNLLDVNVEDRPTIDNLRRRIGARRRGYHLFHFVGHAFKGGLILEDRAGYREDLKGPRLAEFLRLCPDLRLAVFAGCETARPAADPSQVDTRKAVGWRDLLSLADYCVQEACPSVIGMQAVLPFSTERIFTRFFYQALASGYTIAESLRLARGAIQADQRVGGNLLDWSVPTLIVGSGEPGAMVPRAVTEPKPKAQKRVELNLGLRQSNERFFGRDLPLRQAVDVLAGRTPERVLVVTGAPAVGKTSLVDRALSELDDISHVLFVNFDHLAPDITQAWDCFAAHEIPAMHKLSALDVDDALKRLCSLTDELLRCSGYKTRDRDANWKGADWWERLVEDMVQHRYVMVIDSIGPLDRLQRGLLEKLMGHLLKASLQDQAKVVGNNRTFLNEMTAELAKLQNKLSRIDHLSSSGALNWISIPEAARKKLEQLPDRLRQDCVRAYTECLERVVLEECANAVIQQGSEPFASREDRPDRKRHVIPRGDWKPEEFSALIPALRGLEDVRLSLGRAMRTLADRRSHVRIVITSDDSLKGFFDPPDDIIFEMRLGPLTWPETWRWIRRNLPGLVRYGESYLSRLWGRFGMRLELWEELERLALKDRNQMNILTLASKVSTVSPALFSRKPPRPSDSELRHSRRPLQIAVAGPFLAGPDKIAEAITRMAMEHGIGGNVVEQDAGRDRPGALAKLINIPSPFENNSGQASQFEINRWLRRVITRRPDIILLDYGEETTLEYLKNAVSPEQSLFQNLQYSYLLIAAGGNKELRDAKNDYGPQKIAQTPPVTIPSAYPGVLGIGPLNDEGGLRNYAKWHHQIRKPDLFMADNLSLTPLAGALNEDKMAILRGKQKSLSLDEEEPWGSGFSALHAAATAALVWAILPDFPPRAIRDLLLKASYPIYGTKYPRALTVDAAVTMARHRAVEETLRYGAASLQTLSAITGLDDSSLSATLEQMIQKKRVARLPVGRLERFLLIPPQH
jgi:hypothetical protein